MKMFLPLFLAFACVPIAGSREPRENAPRGSESRAFGEVEILTPTNGVDFTAYVKELYDKVLRKWYATMPESVVLGEKGKIVVRFRIIPDGKLQENELTVESASGKGQLRRLSIEAINASSPFKPLPKAFDGPYIELRFIFLYNLPVSAAKP